MKPNRGGFGTYSLAILVCLVGLGSSWATVMPPAHSAPVRPVPGQETEVFDFSTFAPYWSTEAGFISTLEMKNLRVDEPLTVTPVLYPLGGRQTELDPITLDPSETRVLNINEALAARGETATVGAAELRYRHTTEGVFGAHLTVLNRAQSLISVFSFQAPQPTRKLEGVWWFYDSEADGAWPCRTRAPSPSR